MKPTALIALDELFQDFTSPGETGESLVVVQHAEIICQRSYGLANLEKNLRLSHTTVFNLSSVYKSLTACAILLLVQADKLSLDDEVHQHLPELPDYGALLSVHHVLQHTSGLRDTFPGLLALAEGHQSDLTTFTYAQNRTWSSVCQSPLFGWKGMWTVNNWKRESNVAWLQLKP